MLGLRAFHFTQTCAQAAARARFISNVMTDQELSRFADSWIAYWVANWTFPENAQERKDLSWVFDREYELIHGEPEQLWRFIKKVLSVDSSNRIQEVLSAGPLEDLLAMHGDTVIEWVESEAKSNPLFARLLGGVWKSSMTNEVWSRVQAVWNRKGWDGIV
jgi:hypothetical protein